MSKGCGDTGKCRYSTQPAVNQRVAVGAALAAVVVYTP